MKTDGAVADARAQSGQGAAAGRAGVHGAWSACGRRSRSSASRQRWFSLPNISFLWPVPLLTALTALLLWRWLEAGREVPPFLAAIALFLLGYLGLVISSFPYLVPPTLTVWQTAAAPASQISC